MGPGADQGASGCEAGNDVIDQHLPFVPRKAGTPRALSRGWIFPLAQGMNGEMPFSVNATKTRPLRRNLGVRNRRTRHPGETSMILNNYSPLNHLSWRVKWPNGGGR